MREATKRRSVDQERLNKILERTREALDAEDYEILKGVVDTLAYLTRVAEDRQTTIRELRRLLFGSKTEKTRNVLNLLKQIEDEEAEAAGSGDGAGVAPERARNVSGEKENREEKERKRAKGHGRNGSDAYVDAERIPVAHGSVRHGDRCPGCLKGKIYELKNKPAALIRIVGQTPIQALPDGTAETRCGGGE